MNSFKTLGKEERASFFHLLSLERDFRDSLAESLISALRALSRVESEEVVRSVVGRIAQDADLLEEIEDILDSVLILERQDEPARPFNDYLAEGDK